jgi:hypothetical protein
LSSANALIDKISVVQSAASLMATSKPLKSRVWFGSMGTVKFLSVA